MFGVDLRLILALGISYVDRALLGGVLILNSLAYLRKRLPGKLRAFLLFYSSLVVSTFVAGGSDAYSVLYDIVRYTLPLMAYFFGRSLITISSLDRSIIKLAQVLSSLHFIWIILILGGDISRIFNDEAEFVLKGFIELLAIHLILKDKGNFKLVVLLSLSVVLYASRTTLLLLILQFFLYGRSYFFAHRLRIIISFVVFAAILAPTIVTGTSKFSKKLEKGLSELSWQDDSDVSATSSWRGYEAYQAINSVCCSKTAYLLGKGLGSKIDLGLTMSLGNGEFRYVSKIHNVYAEIYAKGGIIGLALLIRALFFYYGYYSVSSFTKFSSAILIFSGLVVGGLFNTGELFFMQLILPKMREL